MKADVIAQLNELHRRVDHHSNRQTDDATHLQAQLDALREDIQRLRTSVQNIEQNLLLLSKAA